MYTISKEIQFDAGHRVPLHASKCRNPHGHRYRVVAHVMGELIEEGPETGMVRDFSIVKQLLTELVHDKYDHGFIVQDTDKALLDMFHRSLADRELGYLYDWKIIEVPFPPTAECLAKDIYKTLKQTLPTLVQIDVWETPTSCASYALDFEGLDGEEGWANAQAQ